MREQSKIYILESNRWMFLSSNIFKIFLNDFSYILEKVKENSVSLYGKRITSLLYADDLILVSDNLKNLQFKLNLLEKYCKDWCLRINTHKTKVIIFNKCGHLIKEDFKIGGDNIECVNKCKYLGIIMSSGGAFKETKNMLYFITRRLRLHLNYIKM